MKKVFITIISMLLPMLTMGKTLLSEIDFTGITQFTGWYNFDDSQTDGKVAVNSDGVAITVGIQTGQLWQPQVMVVPDGSFNLEKGSSYIVIVTAKFPTNGTLQINMGSWSANDEDQFPVTTTGGFQEVICEFEDWQINAEGAHLIFQCGDFKGTTILKKIQIWKRDAPHSGKWTVAGDEGLLGIDWDATNQSNLMYTTDDEKYTLTKKDVMLPNGTYKYKVYNNTATQESYPSSYATLTINENAIYKVIFAFNINTKEVTATATKTDGIYYNYISEGKIAEVIQNPNNYKGKIIIPETVTHEGIEYSVTKIANSAFSGCTSLTSVTIPNSVTNIGNNAFYNCSGLTSAPIPNRVISIGEYAFYNCKGLTSVTIPNSVNSIGNYTFYGCNSLTSVIIGSGVTSIGSYAFNNCGLLTSVIIGSGVTSIGSYAFNGTNILKTIWLTNTPPTNYSYAAGALNYVSNDKFTSLSNTIKYQFLSSYFDVEGVRYVPISPSEKTCDAIDCVYDESASDTKIASTVVYKGVSMNVKKIQPYLAYNNKYIKTLSIDTEGELADYAFAKCSNMEIVSLGQKVSSIGKYAFYGCSSIEAIDIPDIVTVLNESTFSGCTSLNEIHIKSKMTNIGNYVFSDCSSLKRVIIEDSENDLSLGSNGSNPLFKSCPLDNVYIGRNINYNKTSSYGYSPFYRNTSLKSVEITDKETEISDNEFYGCTNLQRVTIGDGITTIGSWAFSGCQSLQYFAFGSQVATIGQEAFSDCAAVTEIISKATTPPVCGNQALDDINKWDCKLYVPDGCMAAYEAANQWMDFFFKEEGEGTATQNPEGQPETGKCEKPTITIANGKIHFACATEGVSYTYHVTATDPSGVGNDINPSSLKLTVYASKPGFETSDGATIEIAASAGVFGDLNKDGTVNVADHVELTKIILGQE